MKVYQHFLLLFTVALNLQVLEAIPFPGVRLDRETLKQIKEQLNSELSSRTGQQAKESIIVYPENDENTDFPSNHFCKKRNQRYHKGRNSCFTVGDISENPCNSNMKFYGFKSNRLYGDCDCDYNSQIPMVYDPLFDKCYPIYDQAYCKPNEWLIFDENQNPICEDRKCPPNQNLIYFEEQCTVVNEPSPVCTDPNEKLVYIKHKTKPVCLLDSISEQEFSFHSISQKKLENIECLPGKKLAVLGQCSTSMT